MEENKQNEQNERVRREHPRPTVGQLLRGFFAWFKALPGRLPALFAALRRTLRSVVPGAKHMAAEQRERRFPESNQRIVQLFLLLVGLFPMWRSLAAERWSFLRRTRLKVAGHEAPPSRARRLLPLLFAGSAAAAAGVFVFSSFYTTAAAVSYNGQPLDIVAGVENARRVAARVEGITADTLGSAFSFSDDCLEYTEVLVQRSEVSEDAQLEKLLTEEIGLVTYGYSLYIDGELIGSTEYEGALDDLLEQIKRQYASEDTLSVSFVEDVEITEGYLPTDSLVNLGYIAEKISSTKAGEVVYTVVQYDTWGKIANDHGMSSAQLEELNPGYDINRINVGDELTISNAVPYLTIVVTERQNYIADVEYEVEYVEDNTMFQGDTRVISEGAYGKADVVDDVELINGVETKRTRISSVTLTDPVTEVRAKGTKVRPTWYPTGSFRWPASGRITSGFGYRNTGIRGASRNHLGIDIACAYGSPICAADGGTVTFTGYKGAMGYTVIIDHGNGFITYYEHCSSFVVSAGAHVYKGQQIARVGSSGVSSGAHCHFGVMKNGSYVNPLKYLP